MLKSIQNDRTIKTDRKALATPTAVRTRLPKTKRTRPDQYDRLIKVSPRITTSNPTVSPRLPTHLH